MHISHRHICSEKLWRRVPSRRCPIKKFVHYSHFFGSGSGLRNEISLKFFVEWIVKNVLFVEFFTKSWDLAEILTISSVAEYAQHAGSSHTAEKMYKMNKMCESMEIKIIFLHNQMNLFRRWTMQIRIGKLFRMEVMSCVFELIEITSSKHRIYRLWAMPNEANIEHCRHIAHCASYIKQRAHCALHRHNIRRSSIHS